MLGGAEALLLRQLCLHMARARGRVGLGLEARAGLGPNPNPNPNQAFPTEREGGGSLPAYFPGESRLMLEELPELGFFRDIVFLSKMLMARRGSWAKGVRAQLGLGPGSGQGQG